MLPKYVMMRLLYALLSLFLIATITFFCMHLLPGSPFQHVEHLSEEQLLLLEDKYGLNESLPSQYVRYMTNLLRGDLGQSFQYSGKPVTTLIAERIAPSAQLGLQALIVGTIFGCLLGMVAALKKNTIWDFLAMLISMVGISIPSFVFAGLIQYYIGAKLGLLPVALWGGFSHTILPTISLSLFVIAATSRFMRTEMVEVLNQDYILTAQAKGIHPLKIVLFHTFRNSVTPIVTIIGPIAVNLMTGTLVVEKIFSIPGIGEQFVLSIMTNDYPVIMGLTLFYSTFFVLVILVVDVLYRLIDPRVRLAKGEGL